MEILFVAFHFVCLVRFGDCFISCRFARYWAVSLNPSFTESIDRMRVSQIA